jgi:hypothetical protein
MDGYHIGRFHPMHPDSISREFDPTYQELSQKEIDRINEVVIRTPVNQIFK